MSKSILFVLLLALMCVSCGGTTGVSLHATPTEVPLVTRNYEIIVHGLRADACKAIIFGFGIDDMSYARAISEIHKQVPRRIGQDYQLVNVVEDKTFEFFLFGGKKCTVISADVAVLLEPVAQPMVRVKEPSTAGVDNPHKSMVPTQDPEPEVGDKIVAGGEMEKEKEEKPKEKGKKKKKEKGKKAKGALNPY